MFRNWLMLLVVVSSCGQLPTREDGGAPEAGGPATGGGTSTGGGTPTAGGAGGGASTAGGMARVDGGASDAGCRVLTFSSARLLQAQYLVSSNVPPEHYGAIGQASALGPGLDALNVEFWWYGPQASATLPYRTQLAPTTLGQCTLCVTLGEDCSSPSRCQRTFLAQSGGIDVLVAERSIDGGSLVIEGSRVSLKEWNRASDSEVVGGACVEVPSFRIVGSWGAASDAGIVLPDAGSVDRCLTSSAAPLATLGCNGWASGQPAPNTHSGSCTTDNGLPQGSCTSSTLTCNAGASNVGRCIQYCPLSTSYLSTGSCNQGYRCVRLGNRGICFRDCDATHPCPSDQRCDSEGSCVD